MSQAHDDWDTQCNNVMDALVIKHKEKEALKWQQIINGDYESEEENESANEEENGSASENDDDYDTKSLVKKHSNGSELNFGAPLMTYSVARRMTKKELIKHTEREALKRQQIINDSEEELIK